MAENVVNIAGGKVHLKSFYEEDGRVFPHCGVSMMSRYKETSRPVSCGTCLAAMTRAGEADQHEHVFDKYIGSWPSGPDGEFSSLYACACSATTVIEND